MALLTESIKALKLKANKISTDELGDIYIRGQYGTSKIFKDGTGWRVCFFELGELTADEYWDRKQKQQAVYDGLQWAVNGRV